MEDKILALLKAKFSGEREDGLNLLANAIALQVNTEEEGTKVVEGLTEDKVKSYISNWRKKADTEVTKANQTFEDNLKKKFDFVEKKKPDPDPTPKTKTDPTPEDVLAKALEKALAPLHERLASIEKGKTETTRLAALTEALKEANPVFKAQVLKSFEKMSFGSEDDFNNYVKEIKTDSDTFSQELHNQGLRSNGSPYVPSIQPNKKATEKECDAVVENLNV